MWFETDIWRQIYSKVWESSFESTYVPNNFDFEEIPVYTSQDVFPFCLFIFLTLKFNVFRHIFGKKHRNFMGFYFFLELILKFEFFNTLHTD